MRKPTSTHFESIHIDMTPMVDCIMVLLVFLMVSSAFVNDPGVEVQKPDVSGTLPSADVNAILLAITNSDQLFFEGQEIKPDQVAARLRQAAVGKDPVVIIRADRSASHGMFSHVYSEAKKAGIGKVQFATQSVEAP